MTVSSLPAAPNRATDSAATFSSKADALLAALVSPFVGEVNATSAAISASESAGAVSAAASALSASASAASAVIAASQVLLAQSSANMKGLWSALSGALAMPASVSHAGRIWALVSDLANVALATPGVSAAWLDVTPAPDAYVSRNTNAAVSLPVSTAASSLQHRVTIDSTRELLFFYSTAAVQAVCYDNSSKTFGNAVLVRTATNARLGALLIGTDKVLVGSCPDSSTAFEAVVLTLSGSVITVNTAAPATLPETLSAGVGNLYRVPVAVGSSYVFGLKLASSARAIAVTVSGTTPSIGSALSLYAGSVLPSIRGINSTRLLAVFIGAGGLTALPVTVSAGTTLTAGTLAATTGSAFRFLTALSTGRWAVVYTNTNCLGAIISVAGTVASITTVTLNAAADLAQGAVVKIGDQLVVQCSATVCNVLTDSAGTATAGTAITTQTLAAAGAACGYGTDYAALGGSSTYAVVKISGNNPVFYEAAPTGSTVTTSNSNSELDDGPPSGILSLSGRSALAITAAGGLVNVFGASAASVNFGVTTGAVNASLRQSDSVLWAAGPSVAGSGVRVHRMEMV